jgi:hypothetical protein
MFTATEKKWKDFGGNINIYDDLVEDDIADILTIPYVHSIQFYEFKKPKPETFRVLDDKLFSKRPDIGLSIFWYDPLDWKFMDYTPNVKNLKIQSYLTKDFLPLRQRSDLTQLLISETKSSAVDVGFISEFKELKTLSIDGMKKGIPKIESLGNIENLNLRGVKLTDLNFIKNFKQLRLVKLMFGHYDDLSILKELQSLVYIGLSRVRGIEDFHFLVDQRTIEFIHFEGMSRIEVLPSLTGTKSLKKIQIQNMARLVDLKGLSDADSLEEFVLSFPENVNRQLARKLLTQAIDILVKLPQIKRTNILEWTDWIDTSKLKEKGLTKYDTRESKWKYNREGGWTL